MNRKKCDRPTLSSLLAERHPEKTETTPDPFVRADVQRFYDLTTQASDGIGGTATIDVRIDVGKVVEATVVVGSASSFTVASTGFPAATFDLAGPLPAGVGRFDNGDADGPSRRRGLWPSMEPIRCGTRPHSRPGKSRDYSLDMPPPMHRSF